MQFPLIARSPSLQASWWCLSSTIGAIQAHESALKAMLCSDLLDKGVLRTVGHTLPTAAHV